MGALKRQALAAARWRQLARAHGQVRRSDHADHALHAHEPGIGCPVLPRPRRDVRHRGVRRGFSDSCGGCRGRDGPRAFCSGGRRLQADAAVHLRGGDGRVDEAEVDAGLVADEESILTECTQARVPSKWLSWHYRSQDEALIAFSNHHTTRAACPRSRRRCARSPQRCPTRSPHRSPITGSRSCGSTVVSSARAGAGFTDESRRSADDRRRGDPSVRRRRRHRTVDRHHHVQRPAARPHRQHAARRSG